MSDREGMLASIFVVAVGRRSEPEVDGLMFQ